MKKPSPVCPVVKQVFFKTLSAPGRGGADSQEILKDQGIQGVALASDRSSVDFEHAWAKHGIKPHLLEGYLTSNNPDFEAKAADVIGLYLEPAAECGGVQRR